MRDLNKAIAVLSLVVPTSAYSLGIGEIKLHSALNQSLDAEIALFMSKGESLSDIQVKLAPPEKFDEAGVAWSYFLSKIKFEAVSRRDGSTIVKLTSEEILREPFLDFLLEVSWPQGNLYREFTVLIDPPAAYAQPVVPVIQKVEQETNVATSFSEVSSIQPSSAIQVVNETSFSEYGPTNRSDSLWKVAEKTNTYDGVSIEQMMMAIYQVNPNAFYKDNVNALMADKLISIPEKELVLKLSRKQAIAAFKRQNDAWNGRVDVTKREQQLVSDSLNVNKQLELEAPVEAEIKDGVVVVSDNEVLDKNVTELETKKGVVVSGEEILSLQARMDKLEQQLGMMQEMLVLKEEQIAALQNQKKTDAVDEFNKPQLKNVEAKVEPKDQSIVKPETKIVDKSKNKVVKKTETKSIKNPKLKPKAAVKPKTETSFMSGYLAFIISGIGLAVLGLLGWFLWNKRKDEELTESESMFATASEISMPDSAAVEDTSLPVADDTSYDVGTVGESSFLSEFTPSDFDAFDIEQDEIDPISEADVYLAYGRYQQAEDLIRQAISDHPERDECKLKLLEIFYANEDKVAFGEYADELVSSGKHKEHEFWAKVTEMGSELIPGNHLFTEKAGGKASFEADGQVENVESIFAENVLNETVELSVNDQLASKSLDNEDIDGVGTIESFDESAKDLDFDLSVFEEKADELKTVAENKTDENDTSIDFDLSVFDLDESMTDKTEEAKTNNEDEVESIDFDLNNIDLGDPEDVVDLQKEDTGIVDDKDLDFDLSIFENEESGNDLDLTEKTGEAEIESIEFDLTDAMESVDEKTIDVDLSEKVVADESLDDFDFTLGSTTPSEVVEDDSVVNEKIAEEVESFDEFDFNFDVPLSPSSETLTDQQSGVSDLTDMDELETKMDLAKAYVDMGDSGSAKKIAEEVLEKGTEDQKKVAQSIIDQLQ